MKMGEDKVNSNAKVVNSNVFDLFKSLNSDDSTENIDGSVQLLKYFAKDDVRSSYFNLKKNHSPPSHQKTHTFLLQDSIEQHRYALKRIVRGLGASTCSSKTVFFRTLVGMLTLPSGASLSVDEIVQVMEKELKIGKEIKNKVTPMTALSGEFLFFLTKLKNYRKIRMR